MTAAHALCPGCGLERPVVFARGLYRIATHERPAGGGCPGSGGIAVDTFDATSATDDAAAREASDLARIADQLERIADALERAHPLPPPEHAPLVCSGCLRSVNTRSYVGDEIPIRIVAEWHRGFGPITLGDGGCPGSYRPLVPVRAATPVDTLAP